jgi:DNA polymerase III alpha subunit
MISDGSWELASQAVRGITEKVKKNHGLSSVCSFARDQDWSAEYVNDVPSLATARRGNLDNIYLLNEPKVRELIEFCGVRSFDDLINYIALVAFRNEEDIELYKNMSAMPMSISPILQPIIGHTHGLILHSEQVMRILVDIGRFSYHEAEQIRKSICKKRLSVDGYRTMFVLNASKSGWGMTQAEKLWDSLVKACGRSSPRSHLVVYAYISARLLWLKTHFREEFEEYFSGKTEMIREKAYYLWEQAGRPEGDGKEFWEQAERSYV